MLKNDSALNDLRIEASKYGPLADILQFCKDLLNEDSFKDSMLEIIKIAKRGVGVATRAGAANFIIELSVERPDLITQKQAIRIQNASLDVMKESNTKESLSKILSKLFGSMFRMIRDYEFIREQFDKIMGLV